MNPPLGATASWPAIGTTALVRVLDPAALPLAEALLRDELDRIDRAASSYRSDSELTRVNSGAGGVVAISEALAGAIRVALAAAAATDGLVDPTLGAEPGWADIDLLPWALRVAPGARLDLGATAKALCADRAAARIAAASGSGVLVSLGGDIALAGPAPADGWEIHVTDDHRAPASAPGQRVWISDGALATSGTTVRRAGGGDPAPTHAPTHPLTHHIIDPRTRLSAAGPWRTASVTAANCVDANTASTAAIILGESAPQWLSERGLSARLVARDGEVVCVGGWPAGAERMPALAGAGAPR